MCNSKLYNGDIDEYLARLHFHGLEETSNLYFTTEVLLPEPFRGSYYDEDVKVDTNLLIYSIMGLEAFTEGLDATSIKQHKDTVQRVKNRLNL